MCTTLEDINWADIMNSVNTLDTWSCFRVIFQEIIDIDTFAPLSRSGNKKSTYMTDNRGFWLRKLKRIGCGRDIGCLKLIVITLLLKMLVTGLEVLPTI